MIETVIDRIKQHLNKTTENINVWFDKSEELRDYRPLNGGWSINEILEHIALTSHFLLKLIDKGGDKALKNAENMDVEAALKGYQFEEEYNKMGK